VLFAELLKKRVLPSINSYMSKLRVTLDRWRVPWGTKYHYEKFAVHI